MARQMYVLTQEMAVARTVTAAERDAYRAVSYDVLLDVTEPDAMSVGLSGKPVRLPTSGSALVTLMLNPEVEFTTKQLLGVGGEPRAQSDTIGRARRLVDTMLSKGKWRIFNMRKAALDKYQHMARDEYHWRASCDGLTYCLLFLGDALPPVRLAVENAPVRFTPRFASIDVKLSFENMTELTRTVRELRFVDVHERSAMPWSVPVRQELWNGTVVDREDWLCDLAARRLGEDRDPSRQAKHGRYPTEWCLPLKPFERVEGWVRFGFGELGSSAAQAHWPENMPRDGEDCRVRCRVDGMDDVLVAPTTVQRDEAPAVVDELLKALLTTPSK